MSDTFETVLIVLFTIGCLGALVYLLWSMTKRQKRELWEPLEELYSDDELYGLNWWEASFAHKMGLLKRKNKT